MPIVLDGESRIDDEFVESDSDDAPNDSRVWSPFEVRTLFSLIVKGLHNPDPKNSRRRHRYKDVTEKLNRALNPGEYDNSNDIPVRAVAGMIKSIMNGNKGGIAFSDRSHAPRLTRRVMQRLGRNFNFDGSILEWKQWRKMTERLKVKPPKEPYRRPVEERPVVRDAYGRILDSQGMVASSQWIHSMARIKKKSKYTKTHNDGTSNPFNTSGSAMDTASDGTFTPAINDTSSGGDDRGVTAILGNEDVFRPLNFERDDLGQSQPISQQVPQPSLSSNVSIARRWDQRNTVPDTSSQINNAPQGASTWNNGSGNEMRLSFGNNTIYTWHPVNTSSSVAPVENNSVSSSYSAPAFNSSSFDGAADSNIGTSYMNTVSQNDRLDPALYNWRDASTGSLAPLTPRTYEPISSRGGGGASFAPPTPRMRDLANTSFNDGLSPFGNMNSWPEVGRPATPLITSDTDPAKTDERDSASAVPVFDPMTSSWASHSASTGGVGMNGASLFDDKYEPGSNSENQTNNMSMGMSANADATPTSYSNFNADRLARLEHDSISSCSPYGYTAPDSAQGPSIGSNFPQGRQNRFDRLPRAPQAADYAPPRPSMLHSGAPIYSVERPWVSDNFKENVDPATVQDNVNTTNADVGEGEGTDDVERDSEGGYRGGWGDY